MSLPQLKDQVGPKSSTKIINPPSNNANDTKPDNRDKGLYIALLKTEAIEATFNAPEAATIKNKANTCGIPQTIRLPIPVT